MDIDLRNSNATAGMRFVTRGFLAHWVIAFGLLPFLSDFWCCQGGCVEEHGGRCCEIMVDTFGVSGQIRHTSTTRSLTCLFEGELVLRLTDPVVLPRREGLFEILAQLVPCATRIHLLFSHLTCPPTPSPSHIATFLPLVLSRQKRVSQHPFLHGPVCVLLPHPDHTRHSCRCETCD
jgi:hypothetical protein